MFLGHLLFTLHSTRVEAAWAEVILSDHLRPIGSSSSRSARRIHLSRVNSGLVARVLCTISMHKATCVEVIQSHCTQGLHCMVRGTAAIRGHPSGVWILRKYRTVCDVLHRSVRLNPRPSRRRTGERREVHSEDSLCMVLQGSRMLGSGVYTHRESKTVCIIRGTVRGSEARSKI